jgi:CRP/FNR family transcriptional regulator, cyclic AMP receptor protein
MDGWTRLDAMVKSGFANVLEQVQGERAMRQAVTIEPGGLRASPAPTGHARYPAAVPPRRAIDMLARRRAVRAFLTNPLLQNVPVEAVEQLVDTGYEKTWLHGELLLQYQEDCAEIHIVLAGALEASWISASGARVIAEYIQPNEVINIIPALDGRGSLMDMRAHGTTTVFHIPRAAMLEMFTRVPELMRGFFQLICSRSRAQHREFRFARLADFRTKIAERLLSLADRYGRQVDNGVEIALKLSQDDLASLLGVSRQSINKELRNFADHGWIVIRYGQLTILDRESLAAFRATSE